MTDHNKVMNALMDLKVSMTSQISEVREEVAEFRGETVARLKVLEAGEGEQNSRLHKQEGRTAFLFGGAAVVGAILGSGIVILVV